MSELDLIISPDIRQAVGFRSHREAAYAVILCTRAPSSVGVEVAMAERIAFVAGAPHVSGVVIEITRQQGARPHVVYLAAGGLAEAERS
jgi:hypothetical protein